MKLYDLVKDNLARKAIGTMTRCQGLEAKKKIHCESVATFVNPTDVEVKPQGVSAATDDISLSQALL